MIFDTENMWFWESLGPAKSSWDSSESAIFTYAPNHEKVPKIDLKWTLVFPPILWKIWPVFRLLGRVSPNPPLFTAYASQLQLQSPGWVLSVIHPKTWKIKIWTPRCLPWSPLGSPARQNGAPGCQKVPKSILQASKITVLGRGGKPKKASIPSCFLTILGAKIGGTVQNFEWSEDSKILPPKEPAGKKPKKGQHSVLFF